MLEIIHISMLEIIHIANFDVILFILYPPFVIFNDL